MPTSVTSSDLPADLEQFPQGTLAPSDVNAESENAEQFPEELAKALKELATQFAGRDKWIRRWEVQKVRKSRFFWRGMQRLVWNASDGMWQVPYQGGTTPYTSESSNRPQFLDTTNIYQAYGRVVIAALTQNLPSVRFEPDDPELPLDIQAAAAAEKFRKVIERNNHIADGQIDMARFLWTDGRTAAYTRYVVDEQEFGTTKDPETGEETPKGQEVIEFYGVLEVKVPLTLQKFSQFPFLQLSTEDDLVTLKSMYPDVADKITPGASGAGEDQYERIARLSVMQGVELLTQSGDTLTHLVTHQRTWFRPTAFVAIEDTNIRQQLLEKFPKGCKVVFAGGTFCEVTPECMDDHWSITRPLPGDGQDTPALGDVLVSVQERLNDLFDIQIEDYEYGIPATYYDQNTIDIKAMQDQQSLPAAKFPVKNPVPGSPLSNQFFTETPATVTPDMLKHIDDLKGPIAQFLVGAPPALFGESMSDQKTASGYAMARDQALGQMGIVWRKLKKFYAQIMAQAVRCGAENREKDIVSGSGTDMVQISLSDLKGNFMCHPDTDENFPESWTQKRQVFFQLAGMANNPAIAEVLTNPDNQAMAKELIGLDDLRIPGADSRNKQLWEIQQLMKAEPMPGPPVPTPNPVTGQVELQPGQPTSSIPIDPVYDDNPTEFSEVKTWINSDAGRTARMVNPAGFENVRLHGIEHQQAMAQAQQQQAARPPGESINFKDLPPDGQAQMAQQAGIKLDPQVLAQQQIVEKIAQAAKAAQSRAATDTAAAPAPQA